MALSPSCTLSGDGAPTDLAKPAAEFCTFAYLKNGVSNNQEGHNCGWWMDRPKVVKGVLRIGPGWLLSTPQKGVASFACVVPCLPTTIRGHLVGSWCVGFVIPMCSLWVYGIQGGRSRFLSRWLVTCVTQFVENWAAHLGHLLPKGQEATLCLLVCYRTLFFTLW